MRRPMSVESSAAPAAPRGEGRRQLRILVVAAEGAGALVQNIRQWAGDAGLDVEHAPDLPRAVRQLASERWDVVLAVLGERVDEDLTWGVDALRGAGGSPRLIAAAHGPSMGLVLRAEKLGVLDLLALPVRRGDLLRAPGRPGAAATEVALPPPHGRHHAVRQYPLLGQSAAIV